MSSSEHHFVTPKTARYHLIGSTGTHVKQLFFALHGYGYLAKYFARKFASIASENTLFVVPEGLHRFYLDKEHKRVGASWMTREDRLNDIADIVRFLDGLNDAILEKCANAERAVVLGFSQGTATAVRWAAKGTIDTEDLILWAGSMPKDLEEHEIARLRKMKMVVALGDQDEFISEERSRSELEWMQENDLDPQFIRFQGTHDIPLEALLKLKDLLGI